MVPNDGSGAQALQTQTDVTRPLDDVSFSAGRTLTQKIALDDVYKRAMITMRGYLRVTYSSGSPIVSELGVIGRILSRIDCAAGGSDVFKSVDPWFMQKQNLILTGFHPGRAVTADVGTSAPTTKIATTEMAASGAPFSYPATTHYINLNEGFLIHFEHPYAYEAARQATLFNTRNLASAEFRFACGSLDNIQRDETSPVSITYDDVAIVFSTTMVSCPWVEEDPKNPFLRFKEVIVGDSYSAQVSGKEIDLKQGGSITGIHFRARDGHANKRLSDILVTALRVKGNGRTDLANVRWLDLQDMNQARIGLNRARASSNTSTQGYAFLNFMPGGDLTKGLITDEWKSLKLQVDTGPASGTDAVTYTTTATLDCLVQSVAPASA